MMRETGGLNPALAIAPSTALALAIANAPEETRSTCCAFLEAHMQVLEAQWDREVSLSARWDSAMAACALIARAPTTDCEYVRSTRAALEGLLEEVTSDHIANQQREEAPVGGPEGKQGN